MDKREYWARDVLGSLPGYTASSPTPSSSVFGHGVISARVGLEPRSVVEPRMVDGGSAMKTLNGAKQTDTKRE